MQCYTTNLKNKVERVPVTRARLNDISNTFLDKEYAEIVARARAKADKPQVSRTIRLFGFSFYFMLRVRRLKGAR